MDSAVLCTGVQPLSGEVHDQLSLQPLFGHRHQLDNLFLPVQYVRHAWLSQSELNGIEEHPESPLFLDAAFSQFEKGFPWAGPIRSEIDAVCKKLQERFDLTRIEAPGTYIAHCRKQYPDVELWDPYGDEEQAD